jgi:hypothetical protein
MLKATLEKYDKVDYDNGLFCHNINEVKSFLVYCNRHGYVWADTYKKPMHNKTVKSLPVPVSLFLDREDKLIYYDYTE